MLDVNRKKIAKNAYRITKNRKETALRIRVPGGHLAVGHMDLIKKIAEKYGNGTVHITTRQGFEIPHIEFKDIEEINKLIAPLLKDLKENLEVVIDDINKGYPAAGTRNITSCIGNRVCSFANRDTTELAYKIEKYIYPNDYHVKIAISGCPNDCIKACMHDIGILCVTMPKYDQNRCIGCNACQKNCSLKVTGALTSHNEKIKRDSRRCIGCGECVLKCPTSAWTRVNSKLYHIIIMGRTGKKNPRAGKPFIFWADENSVMTIIKNMYKYIDKYIDRNLVKEHVGYIVDRTGYQSFRDMVLEGVTLNTDVRVADHIYWDGYHYGDDVFMSKSDINLKS